eukprot:TRINITY_DN67848_c5_g4_i1.p1 TRINITY_DN67848_c5_g4~~TRINITY_DN67848_c5_g4_i1.p1  ORF type:complete len:321 (-),score=22.56 TRINITY_DN67848_c5_g4_i1:1336-2298(-)
MFLRHLSLGSNVMSSSQPLVILHGLFGNKLNWRSVGTDLAVKTSAPTYSLDLRNHGDSPHSSDMSIDDMADDVVYTCDKLKLEQPILIGHSLGGKVAMNLALRYKDFLSGLVVVDVAPVQVTSHRDNWEALITAMENLPLSTFKRIGEASKELEEAGIESPLLRGFLLKNLRLPKAPSEEAHWQVNLSAIKDMVSSGELLGIGSKVDITEMSNDDLDTLIVRGTQSKYYQPDVHQPIMDMLFPNNEQVDVDADHWVHFDNPNGFLDAVMPFLLHQTGQRVRTPSRSMVNFLKGLEALKNLESQQKPLLQMTTSRLRCRNY